MILKESMSELYNEINKKKIDEIYVSNDLKNIC